MYTQVSAVVHLIDRFGAKPVGPNDVSFLIDGLRQRPVAKSGGYFVFTDIPAGRISLRAESSIFAPADLDLTVTGEEGRYPLQTVLLNPTPNYPFNGAVTALRGRLCQNGRPLKRRRFFLTQQGSAETYKIAQEKAGANACEIRLFSAVPTGRRLLPAHMLIRDKRQEFCLLVEQGREAGSYLVEKGLSFEHARGVGLYPAMECNTDEDGSFFTAFERVSDSVCISVQKSDGEFKSVEEVIKQGSLNELGTINL